MKYPLYQNDTGSFQELAHASDVEFGQLSLLTIAPRCTRGGHYHTRKKEWFCCLHGRCYLLLSNLQGIQTGYTELSSANKEFIIVNPYEAHTVLNPHDQKCELLVISSEEYDLDNSDTIKWEAKEAEGEPACSR